MSLIELGSKRLDDATMRVLAGAVGRELDGLLTWPDLDQGTDQESRHAPGPRSLADE